MTTIRRAEDAAEKQIAAASAVAFRQERTAIAAATAAAFANVSLTMTHAYLGVLRQPETREANWFAPIVDWGMRVINDDDALLDRFSISRATLKRWANGDTTPGPLARDSVITRMEYAVREKYGLPFPAASDADKSLPLLRT